MQKNIQVYLKHLSELRVFSGILRSDVHGTVVSLFWDSLRSNCDSKSEFGGSCDALVQANAEVKMNNAESNGELFCVNTG